MCVDEELKPYQKDGERGEIEAGLCAAYVSFYGRERVALHEELDLARKRRLDSMPAFSLMKGCDHVRGQYSSPDETARTCGPVPSAGTLPKRQAASFLVLFTFVLWSYSCNTPGSQRLSSLT